jgi:hypothetical protein
MKKLILVLALVILFTGCDIKNVTDKDIESVIDDTLKLDVQGTNNNFKGYKFYIPRGLSLQNKKGNNYVLLADGDYYYLYVDIVSYFHKKEIETTFDENLYFSKKISYNDVNGYIKISEPKNDVYFLEIVYNYSKIEAYIKEQNLESAIKNSIKLLSSIEYNDVVLETMIGEKVLSYEEEVYNFFESKREDGNFLDYIEEYDTYDEDKIKDDDVIDLND